MATSYAPRSGQRIGAISIPTTALWLIGTTVLALLAIYFIGIDQGAVSVFGSDMHVHEFVHDGRHFLGFPCH
ncbi:MULTISPECIES: CbtB domain-containing protein [Nocardia]|uniref:CbtB-domain containing protein n=1 Tax=Nocardia arthritidis TaxID=228602 RepID=A0A6G9YFL3_9NOCA|nr:MULTISPECIES: CbtB domain-containing protein [unclassified Nocardia]QIS12011.1 CbtB-domain containing protein [Nocardia arthritidis]